MSELPGLMLSPIVEQYLGDRPGEAAYCNTLPDLTKKQNSAGLCPGRVKSSTRGIYFNDCFNTFCFYICFSFQQSTSFSNPFSFVCNDSAIQSGVHTNFEPSPLFPSKFSNSASTAARTTVSCLYSAHARLPLREPPGL